MGLTIIKNTIPKGVRNQEDKIGKRGVLAVSRGLEVIRSYVLPYVPVKTGRLKGSITTRTGRDSIYSVNTEKRGGVVQRVVGEIGTRVPYAKAVEYGTSRFEGRRYFQRGIARSESALKAVICNTLKS